MKVTRRAARRQFSAEEKIRIVLVGVRGTESVAVLIENVLAELDNVLKERISTLKLANANVKS